MEADTFSNKDVAEYVNKTFVNVELNTDQESNHKLAGEFGVTGIPATYLVTADGERIGQWVGYLGPQEYQSALEKGVAAYKRLKELEPKLKEKPEDFELNKEVAGIYASMGRGRKAVEHYKKAAAKAPDAKAACGLYNDAIETLYKTGEADERAVDLAKEIDRLDPDGKLGYKDNALVVFAMDDAGKQKYDDALAKFEQITTKWPDSDKADLALMWTGYLYHEFKNDNEKAKKALNQVIEKYPKSEYAKHAKEFLEHMKDHDKKDHDK